MLLKHLYTKEENSIMNFNSEVLLIVLVVLVFLFKAMRFRYRVKIDFKLLACALHLDIQPDATYANDLNEVSTSKPDKKIKNNSSSK